MSFEDALEAEALVSFVVLEDAILLVVVVDDESALEDTSLSGLASVEASEDSELMGEVDSADSPVGPTVTQPFLPSSSSSRLLR